MSNDNERCKSCKYFELIKLDSAEETINGRCRLFGVTLDINFDKCGVYKKNRKERVL